MKTLRVFVGTHKYNANEGYYSVTIIDDKSNTLSLPTKRVYDSGLTVHKIILKAIHDVINELNSSSLKGKIKTIIYTNNDQVCFEWNNEYIADGKFSKSTKDIDYYKKIINSLKTSQIELVIKGKEAVLSPIIKLRIK